MHIDGLLVRRSAGPEQRIDQRGKSIRLADDDVGIFLQFGIAKLALEQLSRTTNAAQGVLDLVRQLPNHLPSSTVLNQQRIFPADLGAARNISHFDEQARSVGVNRRYTAVDNAIVAMYLGRRQSNFVRIVIAAFGDTSQDVL